MGLSIVAVFLFAGTMSTSRIVAEQRPSVERHPAVRLLPHLRDRRRRRDQPGAVRPARGRVRAGRRIPHRVLVVQVRAVLPGRVHQHGHRLGARHDAVPRRLAGSVAALAVGRRELRLVADALVHGQGRAVHLRLRLAARHAAAPALRPVHAARLEGAASRSTWSGSWLSPRSDVLSDRGLAGVEVDAVVVVVPALLVILVVVDDRRSMAQQSAPGRRRRPTTKPRPSSAPTFPTPPLDLRRARVAASA